MLFRILSIRIQCAFSPCFYVYILCGVSLSLVIPRSIHRVELHCYFAQIAYALHLSLNLDLLHSERLKHFSALHFTFRMYEFDSMTTIILLCKCVRITDLTLSHLTILLWNYVVFVFGFVAKFNFISIFISACLHHNA